MITQERLKELFDYDPATGWFINRIKRHGRSLVGERAGSPSGHGYRKLSIRCVKYYEHHLAWFYIYGEWPEELDHKNGDRSDNSISNLRLATRTENCFNTQRNVVGESGLSGAYLDKRTTRWYSKIQLGGQQIYLGTFNGAEEAHAAFIAAVELHHGEFAFHNRNVL